MRKTEINFMTSLQMLTRKLEEYRQRIASVFLYDWICIPLVYCQVREKTEFPVVVLSSREGYCSHYFSFLSLILFPLLHFLKHTRRLSSLFVPGM